MDNPTDSAVETLARKFYVIIWMITPDPLCVWEQTAPDTQHVCRKLARYVLTRKPGPEDVEQIAQVLRGTINKPRNFGEGLFEASARAILALYPALPARAPTRSALDSALDPMLGNTPVRKAVADAALGLFDDARRPLTEVDVANIAERATDTRAKRGVGYSFWVDLPDYIKVERTQFTRDTLGAALWPMTAATDSAASDRLAWLEKIHSETMDQNAQLIVERDALNGRVRELEALTVEPSARVVDITQITAKSIHIAMNNVDVNGMYPSQAWKARATELILGLIKEHSDDACLTARVAELEADLAAMKEGAVNPFCDRCKTPSMCEMEDYRFGLVNIVSPTPPMGTIRLGEGLTEAQEKFTAVSKLRNASIMEKICDALGQIEWIDTVQGFDFWDQVNASAGSMAAALRASATQKPEAVDWVKIAKDRSHTSEERYSSAEVINGLCEQIAALRAGGV